MCRSPDVYCPSDQIAKDKPDGACITYAREEIYITRCGGGETLRDHTEDLSVNGTIILK